MGHLYNTLYKNMSHSKMCCSSYPMVLSVNYLIILPIYGTPL